MDIISLISGLVRVLGLIILTRYFGKIKTRGDCDSQRTRNTDEEVLAFAMSNNCTVITLNRYDFIRLHRQQPDHAGIVVRTSDDDRTRLATRINEAIRSCHESRDRL